MRKRGNPGYGKMENIRLNVDKFMPRFWKLMEEASRGNRDDKRFFMQEFNKIQTKMIPQTLDGDGEGGPIQVNLISYGGNPPLQVPTTPVSNTTTQSD
jgi:hypothetical protein